MNNEGSVQRAAGQLFRYLAFAHAMKLTFDTPLDIVEARKIEIEDRPSRGWLP